jgi:hypothetical protein
MYLIKDLFGKGGNMDREDEIKLIAYRLWEEEGCPDGRDCEHWIEAETIWQEINEKNKTKNVRKVPVKRSTTKKRKTGKRNVS